MRGRLQVLVIVLTGVFLAGMILIFAVFTMSPDIAALNRPILLTAFIVALFLSLVCIAWLLRWLLRPYTQLVGEAKRAPVEHSGTTQNEAEFVLETFQSGLVRPRNSASVLWPACLRAWLHLTHQDERL